MQKHLVWVPLLVLAAAVTAAADVQLPRVIGNNMVLQRDKPLPIWGWDEVGQKVAVMLGEASATATASGVAFRAVQCGTTRRSPQMPAPTARHLRIRGPPACRTQT